MMNWILLRLGATALLATLVSGCAAHLQTETVRNSDTYALWQQRMESLPVIVHGASGRIEIYDMRGNALKAPVEDTDTDTLQRIDVYLGSLSRPAETLCTSPPISPSVAIAPQPNVVAVLCDHNRTVVSLTDKVRQRVLSDKPTYLRRVRRLLLEGIFESIAQTPDPLPG